MPLATGLSAVIWAPRMRSYLPDPFAAAMHHQDQLQASVTAFSACLKSGMRSKRCEDLR
jgi:hypothetical protein